MAANHRFRLSSLYSNLSNISFLSFNVFSKTSSKLKLKKNTRESWQTGQNAVGKIFVDLLFFIGFKDGAVVETTERNCNIGYYALHVEHLILKVCTRSFLHLYVCMTIQMKYTEEYFHEVFVNNLQAGNWNLRVSSLSSRYTTAFFVFLSS